MSISILMVVPNRNDATSLYRATGPFSLLRRDYDINMIFTDKCEEQILDMVDIVFMQRPASISCAQVAKMCQQNRTPLWVDYDDLLFDIPRDNPAYNSYMNPQTRAAITDCISAADVVTVSTKQLKQCLQPPARVLNRRVYVVPNALPDKFLHLRKAYTHKPHINWRGSDTHMRDLVEYSGQLIDLVRARPNVTATFIGYHPWFITDCMPEKQAIYCPPMAIGDYFRFMSATNPSVQIVPLASHMFNLCKSNIAWLEGALVGAVTIGPAWPEWEHPGCVQYDSHESFRSSIESILDSPSKAKALHEESWDYIQKNLVMSDVNKARARIIDAMYGSRWGNLEDWPDGGDPIDPPEEEHA